MVPFPEDWTLEYGGQLVTAHPPGGGALFRAYERLCPQHRFSTVVAEILDADTDFRAHEVGAPVRLITGEGEYGAWVRLAGQRRGRAIRRTIAAFFLGDFNAALDGLATEPDSFAAMERWSLELSRAATFSLGRRPRRFVYEPPPGWQAVPLGLEARWISPDHPNDPAIIFVPPAVPIERGATVEVERVIARTVGEHAVRRDIVTTAGVRGVHLLAAGRGAPATLHRELALLVVFPYLYCMRLETEARSSLAEARSRFRALVASFQPLPSPHERRLGHARARLAEVSDHWAS